MIAGVQETNVTTWDRPDLGDTAGAATPGAEAADQRAADEAEDEDMGRDDSGTGAHTAVARLRHKSAGGATLNTSPSTMRTPLTTPAAEGVLPDDTAGGDNGEGGAMLPSFGDRDADGSAADHRPHMERTESQRSAVDEHARQRALEEARRKAAEEREQLVYTISAPDAVIDPAVPSWAHRLLETAHDDPALADPSAAAGDGTGAAAGEGGGTGAPKPLSTPHEIADKLASGYMGGSHAFDVAFGWLKRVHLSETERKKPADELDACSA